MYHPRLRGSHYDMGHHYGSLLYKNGFRTEQLPAVLPEHADFLKASEKLTREVYPEICEEAEGFAEGAQGCYEHLMGFLLSIGITQTAPHCSCFAAVTDEGVLFGRNHDYFKRFKKFTESSLIAPEGSNSFVGQGDTFIGREDGVNDKGLAVGYTFVYGEASQPGITFPLVVRGLLEKCATVEEATAWLRTLPLSTYQNFVVADRSGDVVVVETAPAGRLELRRPAAGARFVVATNNFQLGSMRLLQQNEDRNWYEAETRLDGITQILEEKQSFLTLEDCQAILSGAHGLVCQYPRKGDFDTLWSVAANLATFDIMRAEGNPSRVKFQKDTRLAKAISKQKDK